MAYVGPEFEHDVFVCYSAADFPDRPAPGGANSYVSKVIATLSDGLNPRQYATDRPRPPVTFCLPATPPPGATTVQNYDAAARSSAVLLVFLTPGLLGDPAALSYIQAFSEQVDQDGRTSAQALFVPLRPTPIRPGSDPHLERLLGRDDQANAELFYDRQTSQTLELDRGDVPGPFVKLLQPIITLENDLRSRLQALQQRCAIVRQAARRIEDRVVKTAADAEPTRDTSALSGRPATDGSATLSPDRPQVYLGVASEPTHWSQTQHALRTFAIVIPPEIPVHRAGLAGLREQDELRRQFLSTSQGMVLVRSRPTDPTALHAAIAYNDRQLLRQAGYPDVPWVLVDWVGDTPPDLATGIDLDRIEATDPEWPAKVRARLRLP